MELGGHVIKEADEKREGGLDTRQGGWGAGKETLESRLRRFVWYSAAHWRADFEGLEDLLEKRQGVHQSSGKEGVPWGDVVKAPRQPRKHMDNTPEAEQATPFS